MTPPENMEIVDSPSSILWFDEDGILCVIGKKVPAQTIEEAKQSIEDFKKLSSGKKVCMLLDITNSAPSTKDVRDYMAIELKEITKAMALISGSPLGRMLANLFFGLKPPPYPVKMFSHENEAKDWLKKYL